MPKSYELEDFCFEVPLELRSSLFERSFPAAPETGEARPRRSVWRLLAERLQQIVGQIVDLLPLSHHQF